MRFVLFCILAFSLNSISAQIGHKIEFEVANYDEKELIVGYYFGEQTLVLDTLKNEIADGKFILEGEDTLKQGVYLMLTSPKVEFIQFLVNDDQNFKLITDADQLSKVNFEGSEENSLFYNYLDFIKTNRTQVNELQVQKSELDSLQKDSEAVSKRIDEINGKVKSYQAELVQQHEGSVLAMLIRANKQIDIPEFTGTPDEVQLQKYKFYKSHYFDHIQLDNPATLRTPFLHERIDYYINKLTQTHPDSINKSLDEILNRVKPAEETFRYYLSHFLNTYNASKVVGYDAVYVHLALNYYAKGEAPWLDDENRTKIVDKARRTQPVLIGKKAPSFIAKDREGKEVDFSKIEAEYRVLVFWKPECGHCTKAMPFVVDFQDKYFDKGVRVVSFCTDGRNNLKKCWEGVDEKNMGNLINLADEEGRSRAQSKFYATSTPYIYIIDKDDEILMKRIGAEQLEMVMDEIIKMEEEEKMKEKSEE